MNIEDIFLWKEACASCAIEGNKWAKEMLELWETDKSKFIKQISEVINSERL